MLADLLNIIHFILLFLPIAIFFIPIKYFNSIFKYLFLVLILIPIHWEFLDGNCIFTLLTQSQGGLVEAETDSGFSEEYLEWLYRPIMNIIGWSWDNKGLNKMVNLHWLINFVLLWYFLFFKTNCRLI
jgi:hypothetical protein